MRKLFYPLPLFLFIHCADAQQLLSSYLNPSISSSEQGLPVNITGPDAAINSPVNPGASQTVHFVLHNNIPQSIPMRGISGLSRFISQTNNCGSSLGPNKTCTISMTIAPTNSDAGTSVLASLNVNYGGRYPACYPSSQCNSQFKVAVNNNLANLIISNSPAPLLKVDGLAKTITINNDSAYAAQNLQVTLSGSALASVTLGSSCGSILAAHSSCTVSLTPSASGGAAAGQPAASGTLSATADNALATPSSKKTVYLLNYANIYNNGYIYALTDSSPTVSLTGAVAAMTDLTSLAWGTGNLSPSSATDGGYDSTTPGNMYEMLQGGITNYAAAKSCYDYVASDRVAHVWYLPAICELGGSGLEYGCSNTADNMVTELFDRQVGGFQTGSGYWSSTQDALSSSLVWSQVFDSTSSQIYENKSYTRRIRCARGISYP